MIGVQSFHPKSQTSQAAEGPYSSKILIHKCLRWAWAQQCVHLWVPVHVGRYEFQLLTVNCPFEPYASHPDHYKWQSLVTWTVASTHLDNSLPPQSELPHPDNTVIHSHFGSRVCVWEESGIAVVLSIATRLPTQLSAIQIIPQGLPKVRSPGLVSYCFLTDYHKLSSLNQHTYIISQLL